MSSINSAAAAIGQRLAKEGVAFSGPIASAAREYGLDPDLLAAVAAQETGGPGSNSGANIVGDGGHGHGLFQIDDRWHRFAATAAAMNPAKNAQYAAAMLSGLLKQYGGNVHRALSAYNAGSPDATGTVTRWSDGRKLGYADSVLRHYHGLRGAQGNRTRTAAQALAPDQQSLAGEIFSEIEQTNQLQNFAQGSPLGGPGTTPAALVSPHSYAQMAGIDRNGQSKNDTSWAGVIDGVDDSN